MLLQRTHFIQDVELTAIYPPPALVVKVNDLSNISGSGFPNKKSGDIAVSAFLLNEKGYFFFFTAFFLGAAFFTAFLTVFFTTFFAVFFLATAMPNHPLSYLDAKTLFFPRGMSYAIKINYGNRQYYFASRRDIFFLDFFNISNFIKYE
ncbi:MAG: hypothetical protein LBK71_03265 [Verrucomicrobiales bacterium]|jgi:hypothetical protein|nr:hypothetical protein [Verrucomicrobiales bacterium]